MTIAANLIRANYATLEVLTFVNEGTPFKVLVKQSKSEARTGRVSIYIKADKQAAAKIGVYSDNREVAELVEYVKDELLCEGVC